jgi:hypothetical protein
MPDIPSSTSGSSKHPYSTEQLEFFRMLVQEKKCSGVEIHLVTGIPIGSMGGLFKKLKITLLTPSGILGRPSGKAAKVRQSRKLALIRKKYAKQILVLFGR